MKVEQVLERDLPRKLNERPNGQKEDYMPVEPTARDAAKVIAQLLDHAVYDHEKNDECIAAVAAAHAFLRHFPNAETIAAMTEACI